MEPVKVKLYNSAKERLEVSNYENFYSIVIAMEYLERGYLNNSIGSEQYTEQCQLLLTQYKVALKAISKNFDSLNTFMKTYQFDASLAKNRFEEGVPATIGISSKNKSSNSFVKLAMNTAEKFINVMDGLAIGYNSVNSLYPLLNELVTHLHQCAFQIDHVTEFQGKGNVINWHQLLNSMQAEDNLSESQIVQLKFDIEKAYDNFKNSIPDL